MLDIPNTTLFMLMSVDGKISTGSTDELDVDKDFPLIDGVKEGLHQYYEIEQTTDLWSLNSGRVLAKIGINNLSSDEIKKTSVNFVVIDDGHLTKTGIKNMALKSPTLYLATKKDNQPFHRFTVSRKVFEKTESGTLLNDGLAMEIWVFSLTNFPLITAPRRASTNKICFGTKRLPI